MQRLQWELFLDMLQSRVQAISEMTAWGQAVFAAGGNVMTQKCYVFLELDPEMLYNIP